MRPDDYDRTKIELSDHISLLSLFDSKLASAVQSNVMSWKQAEPEKSYLEFMNDLLSDIFERDFVTKFFAASSKVDFIKSIVYPEINDSMFEISCSESSYCAICDWTFQAEQRR